MFECLNMNYFSCKFFLGYIGNIMKPDVPLHAKIS